MLNFLKILCGLKLSEAVKMRIINARHRWKMKTLETTDAQKFTPHYTSIS